MVPVLLQLGVGKFIRNPLHAPGLCLGFESAHEQAAHFFLDIDIAVHIPQIRHAFIGSLNRIGGQVHMLGRMQRNTDTDHFSHFPGPHAGAIDQIFTGNFTLIGADAGNGAFFEMDIGNLDAFDQVGSSHAGALGQRLGGVLRVREAVIGLKPGRNEVVGIQERKQLLGLCQADFFHLDSECMRHGHRAAEFTFARFCLRDTDGSGALVAGGLARFFFQA